ncbi:stabilizer of axonemal microtubules 5 isoform 3-T3 [Amazona ochrocephala]
MSDWGMSAGRWAAPGSRFLTFTSPRAGGFAGGLRPRRPAAGRCWARPRAAAGSPARSLAGRFPSGPCGPRPRSCPHSRGSACTRTPASASSPQRRGSASVRSPRRRDPPCPRPGHGRTAFPAETGRKSGCFHPSTPSRTQRMRSSLLPGRGTHTGDVIPLLKGMDSPITTLLIKHSLRVNGVHLQSQVERAYDKEHAASKIQHTNVQLGDGCTRFSTSTSEQFPAYDLEPVTVVRPNQYASSIPRGDEDPERNRALASTTTTQLSYPETDCRNLRPRPDLLLHKHPTKLCLGDEHASSHSFSTTQQSDYQPPQQSERVMADSRTPRESHMPFNYHTDECAVTTMKATLVPHRQQKQRPSEEMLQQIKHSHLGLPWRAQDLFRTEQKDQFTPKFRGPADIQKANFQVSCIPLGTLKRYCPQRKVHFAP